MQISLRRYLIQLSTIQTSATQVIRHVNRPVVDVYLRASNRFIISGSQAVGRRVFAGTWRYIGSLKKKMEKIA